MVKEIKLSEFLVNNKIITKSELERALDYQKEHGGKLNEILVDSKIISEDKLLAALRYHLGIPVIDMERITVHEDIIGLITKELAKKHKAIPIKMQEVDKKKNLFVAMSDPLDLNAIADIEFKTGLKIQPVLCAEGDILMSLKHYYGVDQSDVTIEDRNEGIDETIRKSPTEETKDEFRLIKEASKFLQKKAGQEVDIDSYYSTLSKERDLIRAMIKILIRKGIITPDDLKEELVD